MYYCTVITSELNDNHHNCKWVKVTIAKQFNTDGHIAELFILKPRHLILSVHVVTLHSDQVNDKYEYE